MEIESNSTNSSESHKLKPKSRLYLAAVLSLLVWPGAGTFLLGRSREALTQVTLAFLSLVFLFFGLGSIIYWAIPLITHADINNFGHENAFILIQDTFRDNPPRWLGFDSFGVLIFSLFLFVLSWAYSLVSIIIYRKKGTK